MSEDANPRPRRQEQEPATEDVDEVAPGVIRTQLPINLPGLGHVNCYVIEDERGIAVVDPGLPGEDSWNDLNHRLKLAGYKPADIHTAVITHSHFDHFGGAARIQAETGAEVLTHESFSVTWGGEEVDLENEDSSAWRELTDEEQDAEMERIFEERLPWGTQRTRPAQEHLDRMKKMGRFRNPRERTPRPTMRVEDAQVVQLGRREWVALHTPGHTHDHLCLYDPEHGVMFSGDHVLPSITPHIGAFTPDVDPLREFFESLEKMHAYGDVNTVLPAHGHPFSDLPGRAGEIIEHHEHRLDIIRDATHKLDNGTVTEYMRVLFSERAWGDMAESETFAHLEHLRVLGELQVTTPEGITHYHAV